MPYNVDGRCGLSGARRALDEGKHLVQSRLDGFVLGEVILGQVGQRVVIEMSLG